MIFVRDTCYWRGPSGKVLYPDELEKMFQVPDSATQIDLRICWKPGPDRHPVELRPCEFCTWTEFLFQELDLSLCFPYKRVPGTYYLECWYE